MFGWRAKAHHAGRLAVVAERLHGQPRPANPHPRDTILASYWTWGTQRAERLLDELLEYAPPPERAP